MFGPGSIYAAINYYWLLGALLPVAFYILTRYFPRSPLRLLNAPVMLGAMGWLPPYVPSFLSTLLSHSLPSTPSLPSPSSPQSNSNPAQRPSHSQPGSSSASSSTPTSAHATPGGGTPTTTSQPQLSIQALSSVLL